MTSGKQMDLFGADPEPAPFDEDAVSVPVRADPDKVWVKLHAILSEVKTASSLPWGAEKVRYYRTVFPQMTNWLPDSEAAQLRFEFEAELVRLMAA